MDQWDAAEMQAMERSLKKAKVVAMDTEQTGITHNG